MKAPFMLKKHEQELSRSGPALARKLTDEEIDTVAAGCGTMTVSCSQSTGQCTESWNDSDSC